MQDTNNLRGRLAHLTGERQTLEAQISTMRTRYNEADDAYNKANTALATHAYHWQEEAGLQAKRGAAKAERAELMKEMQALERQHRELSERERHCREELACAEYANIKKSDMQVEMGEALARIRDADTRLAKLNSERTDLESKRKQAEQTSDAVNAAKHELAVARDNLDQRKAQAFIDGGSVDLAPYNARIAKAEKRVADSKHNAEAGVAALPVIADRLATLTGTIAGIMKAREDAIKSYWLSYTRLFEIEYRRTVEKLIEIVNTLRVLDPKTGRLLGHRLNEGIRSLRVPIFAANDYPQPVKLIEPDVDALLNRLEGELTTALLTEEETV